MENDVVGEAVVVVVVVAVVVFGFYTLDEFFYFADRDVLQVAVVKDVRGGSRWVSVSKLRGRRRSKVQR